VSNRINPHDGLGQLIALLRPQQFASYARRLMWLVLLLLGALAAGCGATRKPILGIGGIAVLAPTVTAVSPRGNTTGVPINTSIITGAFSEPIAPIAGESSY
jgi:hypothetical protein